MFRCTSRSISLDFDPEEGTLSTEKVVTAGDIDSYINNLCEKKVIKPSGFCTSLLKKTETVVKAINDGNNEAGQFFGG